MHYICWSIFLRAFTLLPFVGVITCTQERILMQGIEIWWLSYQRHPDLALYDESFLLNNSDRDNKIKSDLNHFLVCTYLFYRLCSPLAFKESEYLLSIESEYLLSIISLKISQTVLDAYNLKHFTKSISENPTKFL